MQRYEKNVNYGNYRCKKSEKETVNLDRYFVTLYVIMKASKSTIILFSLWVSVSAFARKEFMTTRLLNSQYRRYSVSIEFPVAGDEAASKSVYHWIGEILEEDSENVFREGRQKEMVKRSYSRYLSEVGVGMRRVENARSYEDANCVTFESTVTDKDSVTWRRCDVATFSKMDGHRLPVGEIFHCSEQQIKRLMWQFAGELQLDSSSADELVIGHAGFIDGWIVVIGPAKYYTGAPFKIRYEVAEPYLKRGRGGGYYTDAKD